MPEEGTPASGGFIFTSNGDGEWQNLGYVGDGGITLTSGNDELEPWADKLLELSNKQITFWPIWYTVNPMCRLLGVRPAYTIRLLRRGGKSHRKGRR